MKNLILLSLISLQVVAQEARFSIKTSLDTVYLGNYVEVKFIIENTKGKFKEPSFAGLKIVSGPNTMSSMSIMNGESKSSTTYSYIVKPSESGTYIIEPAQLETEETILKTEEKRIIVVDNPDNILQNPNEEEQSPFDMFISPHQEKSKENSKPKKKTYKI